MAVHTPDDLRADLMHLCATTNADTLHAVIALLEQYGILDGLTAEDAAMIIGRSAIRVRQLANGGDLDGIRFGRGRGSLLLSAASVARLAAMLPTTTPYTGRPRHQRD